MWQNPLMEQVINDSALKGLYARFAGRWHHSIARLGYMQAYADLVRAGSLDNRPVGHVLDVGTGTGALSLAFLTVASGVEKLTVLDNSADMLAEAEKNLSLVSHPVVSLQAGIGTDAIGARSVDTLLCAHVIEHLPDAAVALCWFASRLTPGGRLILSVSKPHWCTALIRWRWGHKAYQPDAVVAMLKAVGFRDIQIVPYQAGPPSRVSCGYLARI